jgi:hypothetical protein
MFKEEVAARCEKVRNSDTNCVDKLLISLLLEQMMHGYHCSYKCLIKRIVAAHIIIFCAARHSYL